MTKREHKYICFFQCERLYAYILQSPGCVKLLPYLHSFHSEVVPLEVKFKTDPQIFRLESFDLKTLLSSVLAAVEGICL